MKRINLIVSLIALTFLISACKKTEEEVEKEYLESCIEKINFTKDYDWIVLLPGTGCHGCIQDGEYFMQQNIGNRDILFILTKISSKKILQQKIKIRLDEHTNIYIDQENLFDIPTKNNIYPCIIKLKEGELLSHSFQNLNSNSLRKLKQQLNK